MKTWEDIKCNEDPLILVNGAEFYAQGLTMLAESHRILYQRYHTLLRAMRDIEGTAALIDLAVVPSTVNEEHLEEIKGRAHIAIKATTKEV